MFRNILITLLFVGTIVAQQSNFTVASIQDAPFINCALLGDTTSNLARCTGCEKQEPQQKDEDGVFQDMTENADGSYTAVGGLGWESVAGGGGHLFLNNITVTPESGKCKVEGEGCTTETKCKTTIMLQFTMLSTTKPIAQESLILTLSGGTHVVPPLNAPTLNGAWWETTYKIGEVFESNCGDNVIPIVYDPAVMDPHTATHQLFTPDVDDENLEFDFGCDECVYEAGNSPTHSPPLEIWYQTYLN